MRGEVSLAVLRRQAKSYGDWPASVPCQRPSTLPPFRKLDSTLSRNAAAKKLERDGRVKEKKEI